MKRSFCVSLRSLTIHPFLLAGWLQASAGFSAALPSRPVEIEVQDGRGRAVALARVVLSGLDALSQQRAEGQTDARGRLQLSELPIGRWQLEVRSPGAMVFHATLRLPAEGKPLLEGAFHENQPDATTTLRIKVRADRALRGDRRTGTALTALLPPDVWNPEPKKPKPTPLQPVPAPGSEANEPKEGEASPAQGAPAPPPPTSHATPQPAELPAQGQEAASVRATPSSPPVLSSPAPSSGDETLSGSKAEPPSPKPGPTPTPRVPSPNPAPGTASTPEVGATPRTSSTVPALPAPIAPSGEGEPSGFSVPHATRSSSDVKSAPPVPCPECRPGELAFHARVSSEAAAPCDPSASSWGTESPPTRCLSLEVELPASLRYAGYRLRAGWTADSLQDCYPGRPCLEGAVRFSTPSTSVAPEGKRLVRAEAELRTERTVVLLLTAYGAPSKL